jgi:hypothetical protein
MPTKFNECASNKIMNRDICLLTGKDDRVTVTIVILGFNGHCS